MTAHEVFAQTGAPVRFEWDLTGALAVAVAPEHTLVVVVDVLSFSTTVSVAVAQGIEVLPFRGSEVEAQRFAAEHAAVLAGPRSANAVSLSPTSFLAAGGIERVVLRSRNGATISSSLAEAGCQVVAGCLRNARAVSARCTEFLERDARHVVVIVAAGERWEADLTLRPAVEDLWGAGAIVSRIRVPHSTESGVAADAFEAIRTRLPEALLECSSGRELVALGFGNDVALASELDVTDSVPRLEEGAFRA